MSLTVLLIHGAWMNATCWDGFKARYEAAGHTVVAPSWPLVPDDVAAARANVDPGLKDIGIGEIVAYYAEIAKDLPEPPVLVGHSFGGLIVQLLLDQGVGQAGVAIDSAPPKGVKPTGRAALASFKPSFAAGRVHTMSIGAFSRGFANTLEDELQRELWERYAVPTPGKPFGQVLRSTGNEVHWDNPERPPLLLIAGEEDHTISAVMNERNAQLWEASPAVTELVVMPGRDHALIVTPGWEEVADTALNWLVAHVPSDPTPQPEAPPLDDPIEAAPEPVPPQ